MYARRYTYLLVAVRLLLYTYYTTVAVAVAAVVVVVVVPALTGWDGGDEDALVRTVRVGRRGCACTRDKPVTI